MRQLRCCGGRSFADIGDLDQSNTKSPTFWILNLKEQSWISLDAERVRALEGHNFTLSCRPFRVTPPLTNGTTKGGLHKLLSFQQGAIQGSRLSVVRMQVRTCRSVGCTTCSSCCPLVACRVLRTATVVSDVGRSQNAQSRKDMRELGTWNATASRLEGRRATCKFLAHLRTCRNMTHNMQRLGRAHLHNLKHPAFCSLHA